MLPQFALPLLCSLLLAVAAPAAADMGYRVVDRKPLPPDLFVQGLEIVDDHLYVSTGQYGQSRLLRYSFDSMALDGGNRLARHIFAEGVTVLGDRVYQLTWRNRALLEYRRSDLSLLQTRPLPGEGWGLTNNGTELIYSDGSDTLHFMDPASGDVQRRIRVVEDGAPVSRLNELEWIDGRIWANVWQTDRILIIDPQTGAVCGAIDLGGLLPPSERRPATDVLNGIARDPADNAVWVTGKYWPWLYRIETLPGAAPESAPSPRESR